MVLTTRSHRFLVVQGRLQGEALILLMPWAYLGQIPRPPLRQTLSPQSRNRKPQDCSKADPGLVATGILSATTLHTRKWAGRCLPMTRCL